MSERSEPRPDGGSGSSGWAEVPGYDLHQLVRRSPASEVYLGSRQGTGADRALTVVYRLAEREATALRHAVEDEAAAARFTGHPAIMAVEGVGLTRAGRVYVAAARPVGFTLERVLAGGRALTLAQARPLALVIAEAVAAAHDYGVVHGRLTPDAIVLVPQPAGRPERVTVCDFGTAPVQDPTLVPGLVPDADRPFVSPERAGGAPPSVRDDVFALGSLLLAACTGVHPAVVGPSGRRRGGVVDADALPGALAAVIERARAADPARRYASAHEFAAALRDVHEIAHETARAEGPDAPVPLPVRITPAAPVARVAPAIPVAAIPGRRRTLAALAAAAAIVAVWSARGWRDRTTAAARAPLDQTARVRAPAGALGDASGAPSAAAGGAGDSRPPARVVERQLSAAPPLPTPAPAPTPRREARRDPLTLLPVRPSNSPPRPATPDRRRPQSARRPSPPGTSSPSRPPSRPLPRPPTRAPPRRPSRGV